MLLQKRATVEGVKINLLVEAHLQEMYDAEVLPSLISSVTDAVADEVKAVYLATGITMTGEKEVLGLWLAQTEGAKFWLQVVTELHNRGVQDIFIACVDGLKGFPDAIEAAFPTDCRLGHPCNRPDDQALAATVACTAPADGVHGSLR